MVRSCDHADYPPEVVDVMGNPSKPAKSGQRVLRKSNVEFFLYNFNGKKE